MLDLAPHSRIWIYQADRFLQPDEVNYLKNEMKDFMPDWAAHGKDIYGDFDVELDLFLIVGADEQKAPASGCSIDSLMRKIQTLGDHLKVNFFDRLKVAYEDASTQLHLVTLDEFKQLLKTGEVNEKTTVYNNLVENVAEFEKNWRTTVAESWHNNLLQVI